MDSKALLVAVAAFSCACQSNRAQTSAAPLQLWYFHHSYLKNAEAARSGEALIDRAAAAGYTGMVLWDSGIEFLQDSWWDRSYMTQVVRYAESKGLAVMPNVAGWGAEILYENPNWAEGQRVVGTQFRVDPSGSALQLVNSFPGLVNGGFEDGQTAWFGYEDAAVTVDSTVSHTGSASALIANASRNARITQTFAVFPWRQYHLRMFYRTEDFRGYAQILVFADNTFAYNRLNQPLRVPPNQDWIQLDFVINSGPHTGMTILTGVWGGSRGKYWLDDISLEETGLVYVLRGAGTPLSVYDPANPAHVYRENVDFGAIGDPQFAGPPPYYKDNWHPPMIVPVLPSGSLKPDQLVAMNWYAAQPVYGSPNASLTDPGPADRRMRNAAAVAAVFPHAAGYFFAYDEMHNMNSTASAKAMHMTPAQLLDWHFNQTYSIFRGLKPHAPIYVWSDMFDPSMNAVNNYYLVEGDLTGSWTGLPADVIMMNWNLGHLHKSAAFFAGMAHRQVVAGYYDSHDGAAAATNELAQVKGIPGVVGMMYTTWLDDYTQLKAFAGAARAAWPAYQASLH